MAPLIRKIILAASAILRPELAAHVGAMEASTSEEECGAVSLLQTGVKLREEQLQGHADVHADSTPSQRQFHLAASRQRGKSECAHEPTVTAAFQRFDASGIKLNRSFFDRNFEVAGMRAVISKQNVSWDDVNRDIQDGSSWALGLQSACAGWYNLLEEVLADVALPDMELILSCSDFAPGELGVLKGEGIAGRDLMVPPRSLLGYYYLSERSDSIGKQGEFMSSEDFSKVNKAVAVFRGEANGVAAKWQEDASNLPLRDSNGSICPRYAAAMLAKRRPDLLNAGFTGVSPWLEPREKFEEALTSEGFLRKSDKLSDQQQQQFETLLVIDGHSLPDRFPIQLSWGLPVVLVRNQVMQVTESTKHMPDAHVVKDEFWYHELVSWEHYVLATPETLENVLETLHAQPELRRRIGEKGKAFFEEHLSLDRLKCYTKQVLSEYAPRFQAHANAELDHRSAPA